MASPPKHPEKPSYHAYDALELRFKDATGKEVVFLVNTPKSVWQWLRTPAL
jgi:hypothetical protein